MINENPILWKDMSDIAKGALLLAHHEEKTIEVWADWKSAPRYVETKEPVWGSYYAYRIKPAPVVKTVTIHVGHADGEWEAYGDLDDTHRITFDLIDGKPDPASVRMEVMP